MTFFADSLPEAGLALATILSFYLPLLALELYDEARDTELGLLLSPLRWRRLCYATLFALIILSGALNAEEFIYFQF